VSERVIFAEEVLHSGDCLNMMKNHSSQKPFGRTSFLRKPRTIGNNFLILILLILIITAGCATQHKYKKYKPVPCPCEKENKR
jgi:hypothetical protein